MWTQEHAHLRLSGDISINPMKTKNESLPDILRHPELHTRQGSPLGHKVFNFMRSHLQKTGYIPAKNDGLFDNLGQQYDRQQLRGRAAKFRRKFRKVCREKGYDYTLYLEKKYDLDEKQTAPIFNFDEIEQKTSEAIKNFRKKPDLPPPAGTLQPQQRKQSVIQYARDPEIRAWVLERAGGRCELCSNKAPFVKEDGAPFLEVHHITQLSHGGPDTLENTVALCPNCHRHLHYGKDRKKKARQLRTI